MTLEEIGYMIMACGLMLTVGILPHVAASKPPWNKYAAWFRNPRRGFWTWRLKRMLSRYNCKLDNN
jgi:hypothetical protein